MRLKNGYFLRRRYFVGRICLTLGSYRVRVLWWIICVRSSGLGLGLLLSCNGAGRIFLGCF